MPPRHIESVTIAAKNGYIDKRSGFGHVTLKPHPGKIPAMPAISRFNENLIPASRRIVEKRCQAALPTFAKRLGARLDQTAIQLWHARRWRAGPRRIGEDMEIGQAGTLNKTKRGLMRRLAFGREAGYEIGAEHHIGAAAARLSAEPHDITRQMARFMRFRIMSSPCWADR